VLELWDETEEGVELVAFFQSLCRPEVTMNFGWKASGNDACPAVGGGICKNHKGEVSNV